MTNDYLISLRSTHLLLITGSEILFWNFKKMPLSSDKKPFACSVFFLLVHFLYTDQIQFTSCVCVGSRVGLGIIGAITFRHFTLRPTILRPTHSLSSIFSGLLRCVGAPPSTCPDFNKIAVGLNVYGTKVLD